MSDDQANLGDGGNNDQQDGGGKTPAWTAQLDKDLQGNERLTQFKTIGEMGKTLIETEGKLKDALFVPGEKATDEERAAFFGKLGRPNSADKYAFDKPELPADVYTPEIDSTIKGVCFKANLSGAQAKTVQAEYAAVLKAGLDFQKAETKKAVNALKDEWKGDTFKENTEIAHRAFAKFGGGEEAKKFIEETKINGVALGDYPIFLKIFASVGKVISDDTFNTDRGGQGGELSEEEKAAARFPNTKFK